jgi:RNA-splicing ligase RtcB
VQHYAALNRRAIAGIITEAMGWRIRDGFETIHNYIDLREYVLRKGAVSARSGERLIIPINMRDGSLICKGKGNADWLCSAPHGAGRLMSRKQAKELLSMDEFAQTMSGVYSTSVCESTIDEAPMAYKPMQEIIECIEPTVEIIDIIRPIYNFKAG